MKKMLFVNLALLSLSVLAEPAQLKLVGDFDVEVAYNGKKGIVRIEQPSPFVVANERHAAKASSALSNRRPLSLPMNAMRRWPTTARTPAAGCAAQNRSASRHRNARRATP